MLTPPVTPMLSTAVDRLPTGAYVYEPKWDGWRVLVFRDTASGVYLQSRSGKPLAGYFPEVTRLARALPPGLVLDGELVIWEPERNRTSFALLQRRVAAGSPVREAYRHPAHLVTFDLLQSDGAELLDRPLADRRAALTTTLADAPPQLTVCPQTTDPAEAREWLDAWTAQGVEGLVIKPVRSRYQPGRRGWRKLRRRHTTEAIVAGVLGPTTRPEVLLLARFDADGRLRYAGRTTPLAAPAQADLAPLLTPAGTRRDGRINHPWPRPLPAGWTGAFDRSGPLEYRQVAPVIVAEVQVDSAYEHSRWRHAVRFVRMRADLSVYDVPLLDV
ncbi:ATP-dependent DNA ligase [Virgisporangium ochraceum]|uniref:ATP-dependent DNA ligase n=1 Tax=Virgisporangium ochraceum TaxID=65505 RepID=A0A8J4ECN3_9ACTN|nr:ATP-dependent DNA ligase [Virgisporangium ochraceum]GIJ69819.1 ATP-dependent DNA ligase [Virgisporangium ochraceum]